MNNMNSQSKIIGTIFVSSILLILVIGFVPSLFISVNALDFDVSDFECIAPVGNIGDNICSEDNSVIQETNNVDNSVTDNSNHNTTIIATQNCGNNSAAGDNTAATYVNSTSTCTIDFGTSIAPSTIGLS